VVQKSTRPQQTKTLIKMLLFAATRMGGWQGSGEPKQKRQKSESPKATVKLRYGKLASPHRARATMGPAATVALLPGLLALVRVREEGQRSSGRISITIDDGYGRVSRRRETIWERGRTDVRLVRFG
jgi:hypothetical protein